MEYVPLPQEKGYDRAQFDYELLNKVLAYSPDYVLLAGYMRILNSSFVDGLEGRLINIHPSLLPSFAGLDTHERALKTGVCVHGCTVHFVNPQLDDGPIIAQGVVPVFKSDSAQTLADRVLKVEHQVYPTVVEYLTQGIVRIDDRVVKFDKEVKTTFYSEEI